MDKMMSPWEHIIIQLVILFTGAASMLLLTKKSRSLKFGCMLGLIGQPFWLYSTYVNDEFGMFALSVWYTMVFIRGYIAACIKERNDIQRQQDSG